MTQAQIEAGYVPASVVNHIRSLRPFKAAIVEVTADKWSKSLNDLILFGSAQMVVDADDSKRVVELAATLPAWKLP